MAHNKPKLKAKLLEELRVVCVATFACKRAGVPTTTYYRWRQEDPEFAADADTAILEGRYSINDRAESNLIKKIQEGDSKISQYWLERHKREYMRNGEYTRLKRGPGGVAGLFADARKILNRD